MRRHFAYVLQKIITKKEPCIHIAALAKDWEVFKNKATISTSDKFKRKVRRGLRSSKMLRLSSSEFQGFVLNSSQNFTSNTKQAWVNYLRFYFNPLSANFRKWSNTLKQFVGKLPRNCLSVFDHFVGLTLKG